MRRCLRLRSSISLLPPRQFARFIHTAPLARARASFTDFRRSLEEEEVEEDDEFLDDERPWNRETDESAYADHTGEQGVKRWRESQDPQAGLQFMTMGREFTIPYSLTQLSNMSNNHLRELRAYYRKMMYEMPQFRSMSYCCGVYADMGKNFIVHFDHLHRLKCYSFDILRIWAQLIPRRGKSFSGLR